MIAGLNNEKHQSTQDLVIMHQKTEEGKTQLKKWSNTYQFTQKDGVTYKDSQTVVSGGNDLKRGVIHFYHETPSAGHPGIGNTYELMKRDFWWPNMKQDAEQYVKGCAACQANKINTHPLKPTIFPIAPVNGLPFQTIAMDFITKLPKSGKYDTLRTSLPTGRGPFGGCAALSDGQGRAARRNGRGQESSKRVYSIGQARAVVYV